MKACSRSLFAVLLLALASTLVASAAPETTEDGLVRLKRTRADAVYQRPGVTFGGYGKIVLLPPQIAFKKDWQGDHNLKNPRNPVSDDDMVAMITEGQSLLQQEFGKALAKGGYTLVEKAGPNVLAVKVSIIDLEVAVANQDVSAWNKTYADDGGSGILVIELFDSTTGQVLARAYDRKGGGNANFSWNTSRDERTNLADATYAFRSWAQMFVKGLEHAKKTETAGK